eukprot:1183276-Pyramimonas_sp.AAC.1
MGFMGRTCDGTTCSHQQTCSHLLTCSHWRCSLPLGRPLAPAYLFAPGLRAWGRKPRFYQV